MTLWITTIAALLLLAALAFADHDQMFPIVKEKALCDGSDSKACQYMGVEECTGLQGVPPLLARTEAVACASGDSAGCLPNDFGGWYHPDHGGVIILPEGNARWFRHEVVHHLLCINRGDCSSHDGPEWACVE